jgi:Zn-dependent protease
MSYFITKLFTEPIFFLRIVVILILSITLHELAHGLAALSQGDDTPKRSGHMTLNPVVHMGVPSLIFLCIAGIAWGAMPVNPTQFRWPRLGNAIVAAAGPLLNLTLGVLVLAGLMLARQFGWTEFVSVEFFSIAIFINFNLFLFNLLPLPPLDGFHVFSEIFPPLKRLEGSPFGFLILMLLFSSSGFGQGLSETSIKLAVFLRVHPISIGLILGAMIWFILVCYWSSKLPKNPTLYSRNSSQSSIFSFDRFRCAKLEKRLLEKIDLATAERLIALEKIKNPGKLNSWYLEKVLYDLQRDR